MFKVLIMNIHIHNIHKVFKINSIFHSNWTKEFLICFIDFFFQIFTLFPKILKSLPTKMNNSSDSLGIDLCFYWIVLLNTEDNLKTSLRFFATSVKLSASKFGVNEIFVKFLSQISILSQLLTLFLKNIKTFIKKKKSRNPITFVWQHFSKRKYLI